ncbi:hypothetical protein [Polaromonas sp. CG_9.11]|uniref:hypothetical protein n=1 Tax=Polaromonas sp. CG_9.11 TaxID=2787730 RepID=UPI0018C99D1B|nr:hypothetical protein [Polaromonas sp. CG_9.11]MBG6076632.1 hypothetical protein [Polaromonas sp. CG_9.11]
MANMNSFGWVNRDEAKVDRTAKDAGNMADFLWNAAKTAIKNRAMHACLTCAIALKPVNFCSHPFRTAVLPVKASNTGGFPETMQRCQRTKKKVNSAAGFLFRA